MKRGASGNLHPFGLRRFFLGRIKEDQEFVGLDEAECGKCVAQAASVKLDDVPPLCQGGPVPMVNRLFCRFMCGEKEACAFFGTKSTQGFHADFKSDAIAVAGS